MTKGAGASGLFGTLTGTLAATLVRQIGLAGLAALGGAVSTCRPSSEASQPGQPAGQPGTAILAASGASLDGGRSPCGSDWLDASSLHAEIRPDAGTVILRAAATGIQRYRCEAIASEAGPSYAWTFVEPRADLRDCHGTVIGQHFSSKARGALGPSASGEATPASPQWQLLDGAYIRGAKSASYTPDGGAGSIPWLLIKSTALGEGPRGNDAFGNAAWISRANAVGGAAPTTGCGASSVGDTRDVDYRADYFFWGP
jgi:hypothetical protein